MGGVGRLPLFSLALLMMLALAPAAIAASL